MNETILFSMKHIKNNIINLSQIIDTGTEEGRNIATVLASLLDQTQSVTDRLKAF
jgi:hypothetical protein